MAKKKAPQLCQSVCDVLFPVAGTTGTGVIEAAITADKWVIGADIDQYENAPRVILTSVVKRTTNVVKYFTQHFHDGNLEGGTVIVRGLKEDSVGIPKENPNIDAHFPQLTERLDALSLEIKNGQRPIPATQGQYQSLSDAS
ncbi:BMP family lipoprotein [Eubacterium aggregans]|uniref:BMP family lipoprotein n=1 Tax=Eubacterium aggregans TaxID=81409 RepID=UPI003F3774DD